jgi:hypothetical protein
MSIIKGTYNGAIVILAEPAPTGYVGPVLVEFPDIRAAPLMDVNRSFHWNANPSSDAFVGDVSEELIRQRRP